MYSSRASARTMNPGIREPAPVVLHKSSAIGENEKNEERRLGDFDYSIRYIRLLLRILGIWHLVATKPAMKLEQHLSKIILASGSLSMITLMVPLCCHIIFRSVDRFEIIILLGPITYQAANIIMHYVLLFRSHTLGLCIRHMEDDWREIKDSNEDDIMKKHVHFSHLLSIACISFMYTSAIAYFLVMPFSSERSLNNEKNETVRPRAFPGSDFFFDAQANVLYELAFTMDFISALFHYTVSTSVCNLAVVLVSHACGQIQIVKWNLENFIHRVIEKHNDTTDTIVTEWIGIIVKKHVRLIEYDSSIYVFILFPNQIFFLPFELVCVILCAHAWVIFILCIPAFYDRFAATIEEALREIFLVEVVASTLIICFVEYDIIIVSDQSKSDFLGTLTYVSLLIAFAFNLFLFCRFGEVLREQSEEIGKVAYMVDWYRLPGKTKLAFIMIINMAHTPCELTAGGMMELSIANFAKIMKTSFAYLNMLRKTG